MAGIDPSGEDTMDPERPRDIGNPRMGWASDVMAEVVHRLGFRYISLTPGASYRGLHDSLVNYLGNQDPRMLLVLNEECAVSIAHGWAKVTEEPMAVAVHANIGLMHSVMAIYNAWCDRVPMFIIGATGPVDAAKRRPWIEWVHTSKDQAAMIRNFVKWDDQPASSRAATESMLRANLMTRTPPRAPVYVCLDQELQETPLEEDPVLPDVARYRPPPRQRAAPAAIREVADLLAAAKRPVILPGRVSRSQRDWDARVRLAELLDARVISDSLVAASFPSRHPLHVLGPRAGVGPEQRAVLAASDVILALDRADLAGTLRTVWPTDQVTAQVINCSMDSYGHNGWSMDHQGLPPVDLSVASEPDAVVAALLPALEERGRDGFAREWGDLPAGPATPPAAKDSGPITMDDLAACYRDAVKGRAVTLTRLPFGWPSAACDFAGPLDYLGRDGGAGVGSAPGIAVGAALALRDSGSGRLPIAIIGDGEYIMGLTALWTAARYEIPLLVIVANNRAFFNDVEHQERMAIARERPVVNKWIGMQIDGPALDLAGLARDQGLAGEGPVGDVADLPDVLARGVAAVAEGASMVIDVNVVPGRE